MLTDAASLRTALQTHLRALTASKVTITELRALAGGASQQMWRLDLHVASGEWRGDYALVVRRQLWGKIYHDALDLTREFRVTQAAYASGVLMPRPYWFIPDLLGRPAALSQWLEGETIGRKIVKDPALAVARQNLPVQMGHALALVHQVDVDAHDLRDLLPAPPPPLTPAQDAILKLERNLDEIGEPHPALELGLRWLRQNEPPPDGVTFLHGDFRIGNMMVNAAGLAGVLDWEFARLGDPAEDLAWSLVRDWRFGNDALHFGGIAQPDEFFAAYEKTLGARVDPQRVYYWEVMGNVRWAVGTLNQAQRHLSGDEPNLEFASLGRRAAEMELEVLQLIRR